MHATAFIVFYSVVKRVRPPFSLKEWDADSISELIQLKATRRNGTHHGRIVNNLYRNAKRTSANYQIGMCCRTQWIANDKETDIF